ncbi:MAG: hypothetical protein DMF57_15430 [Acidobacteria bacterium]|nr:MAG: hypothetical protein DMF57_15430 [Acidobacteriota bacterium]
MKSLGEPTVPVDDGGAVLVEVLSTVVGVFCVDSIWTTKRICPVDFAGRGRSWRRSYTPFISLPFTADQ